MPTCPKWTHHIRGETVQLTVAELHQVAAEAALEARVKDRAILALEGAVSALQTENASMRNHTRTLVERLRELDPDGQYHTTPAPDSSPPASGPEPEVDTTPDDRLHAEV